MKASVGRVVHVVEHLPGHERGACRAATIIDVHEEDDTVDLFVMRPRVAVEADPIPQLHRVEEDVAGDRRHRTWHWPERVE